jgi:hypothetical protein
MKYMTFHLLSKDCSSQPVLKTGSAKNSVEKTSKDKGR